MSVACMVYTFQTWCRLCKRCGCHFFHNLQLIFKTLSCSPRKRACANKVSTLAGRPKLQFSCICSSVMFYPNGTKFKVKLTSPLRGSYRHSQDMSQQILIFFFFVIPHTRKNCYNSQMLISIQLKFGASLSGLKAEFLY